MTKNIKDLPVTEQLAFLQNEKAYALNNDQSSVAKAYDKKINELIIILESSSPVVEKKNENAAQGAIPQHASAAVADAPPQSSITKPNSETDNLDVATHSNISTDNPVLITRFIGLIHEEKFKTNEGYRLFMKVKNRLRTLIVNWLKMKVKRGGDLKKNAMIDLSIELKRIAHSEVKEQFKEEILSIKFFVSNGKKKVFYGCNEELINELFK